MERARREIRAWIRSNLYDEVPMAISVIDPRYRVLEANRRFGEAYGPWRDRLCYQVYKGRSEPCHRCPARDTFADGLARTQEQVGIRDGEEIDYLVQMVPMTRPDGDIPYVIEMSTDITAVKRLEREKRDAERLAAVGETVAGVAHGIKNILMGLEGGMYAVNTGIALGDDGRIARGWTALEDNVERITRFMKEFLDFAKGRGAAATLSDPAEPARQVIALYQERAAQAGIRLRADLNGAIAPAPLDAEGVYTCLANLVSNAIDACTVAESDREFEVTLSLREEGDTLVYEVGDNGRGMDYEISRKVFTRFFTTKGSDRGTGLGLLTTKRIIHQHGGRIAFTSTEGEGSRFRIELPRGSLPEPAGPTGADPDETARLPIDPDPEPR
jgi:PAS domain S-box-containing protein